MDILLQEKVLTNIIGRYQIPVVDLVRSFYQSDAKKTVSAISASLRYFPSVSRVESNISFLRRNGMPDSIMLFMLNSVPGRELAMPLDELDAAVVEMKEMGFDISKTCYVQALAAWANKSRWKRNFDMYKKWGWSEQVFRRAFRSYPACMLISVGKIEKAMNFNVNELGWDSAKLAARPVLLTSSVERKAIPRARVLKYLVSNGLITRTPTTAFLERIVEIFETW